MEIKDKFIELAGPIKPATVSKIATLSEYVMDAALGEFQGALNDKFAIKDDDGSVQKSPFRYVANEEYRLALVDEDGGFLFGVRQNGSVEWTEGIPAPIVAKLQEMADEYKQDKAELAEDLANIENTKADKTELAKVDEAKVDKEEGKGLIATVISDKLSLVDEEGFLFAFKDAEGHFLGGIRDSGSWDIPSGIPDESRALLDSVQKQIDEIVYLRDATYHITEQEGYLLAITDNKGGFLGGIRKSGQWDIPNGIPAETKANLDAIYKALQEVNTTISAKVEERNTLIKEVNDSINAEVDARTSLIKEGQSSYAWVVADKEGNVWLGGNLDGTVDMPKGVPAEVQTMLDNIFGRLSAIEDVVKTPETGGSYLVAMVDANGNELLSISKDGEVTVADGLKSLNGYSVKAVEAKNGTANNLYTIVDANDKVVLNITKEGKMELTGGLSLDNGSTNINVQDTEGGWLFAILDADGKVLGGFRKDGKFFANSIQIDGLPSEYDSDSYLYAITDNENHVLWGILKSGKTYSPFGSEASNVDKKIDAVSDKVSDLETYMKVHGVETKVDFSSSSYIQIPEPRCAVINITGISSMPWSKTQNLCGYLEFWDMQGNYFKKKVIANAQGNSSMGFVKKNAAFDFCDDDWVGDETPSIRFGNWVPQDSFHMKAYYTDFFRGVGAVSYKFYDTIVKTRGNRYDRPWKKELLAIDKVKATTNSFANPMQDDLTLEFDTGARCFPDGFPVVCYLNGAFYGVFSWQLKKHRDNMHQDKKTPEHIHIDGNLYGGNIWNGTVAWNQFEIRNPKSLYCINTEDVSGWGYSALDATTDAAEIAAIGTNYKEVEDKPSDFTNDEIVSTYGSNPPAYLYRTKKDKWYKLVTLSGKKYLPYDGDSPVELIDETMPYYDASNKDHVRTNTVKSYLIGLSNAVGKMKAAETVYNASSKTAEDLATLKAVIETYCDVENQIDYMIVSDLIKNSDGFGKNWQWFTYNGVKWYVGLYDCDMSFGGHFQGNQITAPLTGHISTSKSNFHGYIIAYYADELKARYKELSDMGIISKDAIFNIFKDWTMRIGVENYESEYKKWKDSPCYGESTVRTAYWELQYNEDGIPKTATSSTFNSNTAYAVDDEVSYGLNSIMGYYVFKCVQATQAGDGYSPISYFRHTDNIYRVEKWIETEIENMDKVYGYTRTK